MPLGLLRREPNPSQRRCLRYLGKLVRTYGSEQEGVIPSSAGRRMNALHARLGELSEKLACLGPVADPYAWIPPEDRELPQDSPAEALCPYVPVAADRLQLSGKGSWDPTPYLSDDLWLAYVEPRSLLFGGPLLRGLSPTAPAKTLLRPCGWRGSGLPWGSYASSLLTHLSSRTTTRGSSVPRSRPGDCARLATGAGPTAWKLVFQALPGTFQRARS